MTKIAIIAGGWHFPKHFYDKALTVNIPEGVAVDFYAMCHRNMNEKLHKEYKLKTENLKGPLGELDKELYADFASVEYLNSIGWKAVLCQNTIGDFFFINQWLDTYTEEYDIYIYLSDDVYLTNEWKNFITDLTSGTLEVYEHNGAGWYKGSLSPDWVWIGNCPNGTRKVMRSSTGIFTNSFIKQVGRFSMDKVSLTRTDASDNKWNPQDVEDWNQVQRNLQDFLEESKQDHLSYRLSASYRISKYMIEAERGLLSNNNVGAFQTSYNAGLKKYIFND